MKITIISDVHDNLANLKKVLQKCQEEKIKQMISCGDMASEETLDFLQQNFSGNIWLTPGNMDAGYWDYDKLANKLKNTNLKIFPAEGELEIVKIEKDKFKVDNIISNGNKDGDIFKTEKGKNKNIKIAFVHFPDKAKQLAKSGKYQFVFYGHTHKPWEEYINNCRVLNPGNVANIYYPPSFAIWNIKTGKIKLERL